MADKLSLEILIKTIADAKGIETTEAGIKQVAQEFEKAAQAGKPLEVTADSVAEKLKGAGKSAGDAKKPIDGLGESAKKAGDATKAAGDASKNTAQNLGEFQRAGNGANQMLAGLERASRGGIDGILGAATAVRGFIGVLRTAAVATGPIGIAVAVVGGLALSLVALARDAKPAKESIEDLAKKAEDLGRVRMDNLARDLKAAADAAADAKTAFDAAAAAKERLDNAEQAARLAEIRSNPNLSEEQKVVKETEVRNDFRARDQQRVNEKNDFAVTQAERQAAAAKDATQRPTEDLKEAIKKLTALEEQNRAREADHARLSELRSQGFPADKTDEVDAIGKRLNTGKDVSEKDIDAAKERVRTALTPANEAETARAKAETAARIAREDRDRELATQAKENEFHKKEQTANLATDLPKARATDAAQQQVDKDLKKQIEDLTKARDAEKKAVEAQIDALNESIRGANPGDGNANAIAAQRDALTKQQKEKEEAYQKELGSLRSKLSTAADAYATSILNGTDKISSALVNGAAKINAAAKAGSTTKDGITRPIAPLPTEGSTTKDGITRPATPPPTHSTVEKDGVKSSFAETSPNSPERAVAVRPFDNVQQEIPSATSDNESKIDPELDAFFGSSTPTPSSTAPAPVINPDPVTDAINNAPKPEPVSLQPVAAAFTSYAQQTSQNFRTIKVDVASLQKVIEQHTRELRALSNGLQARAEASQS